MKIKPTFIISPGSARLTSQITMYCDVRSNMHSTCNTTSQIFTGSSPDLSFAGAIPARLDAHQISINFNSVISCTQIGLTTQALSPAKQTGSCCSGSITDCIDSGCCIRKNVCGSSAGAQGLSFKGDQQLRHIISQTPGDATLSVNPDPRKSLACSHTSNSIFRRFWSFELSRFL